MKLLLVSVLVCGAALLEWASTARACDLDNHGDLWGSVTSLTPYTSKVMGTSGQSGVPDG